MTRRTTPQAKTDEAAFPIRVLFYVPENGLGKNSEIIWHWLDMTIGRGNFAWHSRGRDAHRDRFALYFRDPVAPSLFTQAFPFLEIADGTLLPGYYSPDAPFGNRMEEDTAVCNLYNQTKSQEFMRRLFTGMTWRDRAGNLEPGQIYPNQLAPIIRHGEGCLELVRARWGMPTPSAVLKTERDPGVTNVRNLGSSHWRRWLGPAHRCLVPVTSFAEPHSPGNIWFAPLQEETPMFFAGIEARGWKSVRKIKDGETIDDLFAFLTCPP
ncbi:SOS response-associated peptidase family protein [Paenirhodobacter populi]|uniref:SOS response-associated peptidase family protein n=1 Tax=Paenirhodobacter populi TaxID=2306993 RepID=UPI001F4D5C20|nr:SOS response-associated peptidase family protein [Sinirhodobacter populi]